MDTGLAAPSTIAAKQEFEVIRMLNKLIFCINSKHSYKQLNAEWSWRGRQTYPYAAEAAEFGAVWAETGISQFLHADEAAKHLGDALHGDRHTTGLGPNRLHHQTLAYV